MLAIIGQHQTRQNTSHAPHEHVPGLLPLRTQSCVDSGSACSKDQILQSRRKWTLVTGRISEAGDRTAVDPLYDSNNTEHARYWKWNFPDRQMPRSLVNCQSLVEGDRSERSSAKFYTKNHPRKTIHDHHFIHFTQNCALFKQRRGYVEKALSEEEETFPIAFSILFYQELQQVERLLRAIYRPQNLYCLHLDGYSESLYLATQSLVRCFDNVFLVSKREKIVYAGYSRLQADINCMTDVLVKSTKWKYYINLASQDFPLKTDLEMVKILKIYNGSNDIEGMSEQRTQAVRGRFSRVWNTVTEKPNARPKINKTALAKEPPPHNIKLVRGSAYGIFSRNFVHFILNNQMAIDLLAWSQDTYSPDEFYWSTLNHVYLNQQLNPPGAYKGKFGKKRDVNCKV